MHQEILNKKRYLFLDELRGFLVLCMVFYHGFLSVNMATGSYIMAQLFDFFTPVEPYFAGAFIMLSGLCCKFSRSKLKRGLILLVIALALNISTFILEKYFSLNGVTIRFGILNLLSFCMIFVGLFNFLLKKIPSYLGLIISTLGFLLTFIFISKPNMSYTLVKSPYLFPFGFFNSSFYSADYFPIFPWIFIYLFGYYLGNTNIIERFENFLLKGKFPLLRILGKYAIIIYVIHQPVIYGLATLIGGLFNG